MEFYFLNWVQFSYDFGKVVPNGTTKGKVCHTRSSEKVCSKSGGAKKEMKFGHEFQPPFDVNVFFVQVCF